MSSPKRSSHQSTETPPARHALNLHIAQACRVILRASAASVGGALLVGFGTAFAADAGADTADSTTDNQLTEVVVTSDRLSSRSQLDALHDVPKAVAIIGGADLSSLNDVSITDILSRLANVQFDFGNPRTGGIAMRGVLGGTSDNVDPSVMVSVDGVSYVYQPLAAGSDFFDMESVSATRGPQGTEGGYNTSLGEIEFTTRKPTFTPEAGGSLTYGTHNSLLTEAAIGGPLIDGKLAYRVAFERNYADGRYENSFSEIFGRSSYVNTDRTQGRVELLATPFDDFSALLIADYQPKGSEFLNGLTYHLPTPATYANGAPVDQSTQAAGKLARGWFTREADYSYADYLADPVDQDNNGAITTGTGGLSLTLDWKLPVGDLKTISAYRNHYFSAANDDGTPFDITNDGGYITTYRQFTQEVKLNSDTSTSKGDAIDWVGGLYYLDSLNNSLSRSRYGSDAGAWNSSAAQYNALDATAAGQQLMADSQNRVYRGQQNYDGVKTEAAFGHFNWRIFDPLTLGLGLRISHQERSIVQSVNLLDEGYGALLNPVSINDVALGGFNSNATTGALVSGNSAAQLAVANQLAQQYFGAASYSNLTATQLGQVAAAKSLRTQALGSLYLPVTGVPYRAWLPSGEASLSYKINDEVTSYLTYQRGVKSGSTQVNGVITSLNNGITGLTNNVYTLEPEKSDSFELGLNNKLLHNTLIINGDVYLDNIHDYQQTIYRYDPIQTGLSSTGQPVYASELGNLPWVQLKGVELDAIYSGIEGLQIRLSASHNEAVYREYPLASRPAEQGNLSPPYANLSGDGLPNAPRFRGDLDVNYHHELWGQVAHIDVDYNYQGAQNTDAARSVYGWVGGYGLFNVALGLSTRQGGFDISLVAKNALQKSYLEASSWNSYTPGYPAWYGIRIASKFY